MCNLKQRHIRVTSKPRFTVLKSCIAASDHLHPITDARVASCSSLNTNYCFACTCGAVVVAVSVPASPNMTCIHRTNCTPTSRKCSATAPILSMMTTMVRSPSKRQTAQTRRAPLCVWLLVNTRCYSINYITPVRTRETYTVYPKQIKEGMESLIT